MDDLDQAWTEFQKSQSIQKASLAERLDTMAAQLNEIQTTSDRTAKLIPKLMGDEAAIGAAADQSAMMGGAPMGGPMGGAMPGADAGMGMDPSMGGGAMPGGAPMGDPTGGMGALGGASDEGAGMGTEEESPMGEEEMGAGEELGDENEEEGMFNDEDEDLGEDEEYEGEEESDLGGDEELGGEEEEFSPDDELLGEEGDEEAVETGDASTDIKEALKMAVDGGNMALVKKLADAYAKLKGEDTMSEESGEELGDLNVGLEGNEDELGSEDTDLGDILGSSGTGSEEGILAEGDDFAKSADEEDVKEEGNDSDEEELKEGIDKLIEAYLNGTIKEEEAKLDDDVEEEMAEEEADTEEIEDEAEEEAGYDTEPEDEPKADLSEEGSEPFEESEFAPEAPAEAPAEAPVEEPVTKSAYFAEIEGTSFRDLYNIKKSRAFVGEDGRGAIQKAQQPSPDANMESAPSVGSTATIPSDVQEQKQSTKGLMKVPDALNNTNEGDATAEQGGADSFDDTGDELNAGEDFGEEDLGEEDVDLPGTGDALTEEGDLAEGALGDEEEEDEDLDEIEDDIMKSATVADEVECPCKDLGKGHKPVKGTMLDDVGHKKKKSEHKVRGGDLIDDVDEVKKGLKLPSLKGKKKKDAGTKVPAPGGYTEEAPDRIRAPSNIVGKTVSNAKPTTSTTAKFNPGKEQCTKTTKSAEPEKQIMSMRDVMAIRKSGGRPDASTSVNGDLSRPELGNIAKSATPTVRMGRGVDPHKVVESDWNEYKIYKAQRGI